VKTSSMLICPVVPLRQLPPGEVDVIRRFLFDHVRGIDSRSDRRWRRLWGRMWAAEPGEGFQIYNAEERSGRFHRRHRAILERLFDAQERYTQIEPMHDWLKLKAYFVTWGEGSRGQPLPIPRSTSFPKCSEDEIRELHARMVDLLHDARIQRHLFPRVKAAQRQGMVDAVLQPPDEVAA
jgi:hypothetical protein